MSADSGHYTVLFLSSAFDTVDPKILTNRLNIHIGLSGSVIE